MAIESSNRSPYPMSSRQSPNPNFSDSKNHGDKRVETGFRRSANGSPFPRPSVVAHPSAWCFTPKTTTATTSNSPAEIGRRNSSNMNEHKENKKPNPNLKPIKGVKNFMSPTISAFSKVNPSPRKKALAERNEAVRTSASLSDGKFLFFAGVGDDDFKSETESCDFQKETIVSTCGAKKRVTFDDDVVVLSPEVFSGYDVDEYSEPEPIDFTLDEIKEPSLDTSKGSSFVSLASPIAPLDADPFVQPYDPKTNFLSPRPQFLRYKPLEDVSLDLNSHLLKSFEDTLSSETCSDNDAESSVQSDEAPPQEEVFLVSSNSSPSAKLEHSDECVVNPLEEEVSVEGDEEESSDESEIDDSEPRFFSRWRIITWLLFGSLLSSLIVSHAPLDAADFSGSLNRVKEWSNTYLPLMVSSFGEIDDGEFTPSEFLNLSASICNANEHFIERKASGFPSEEIRFLADIGNGVQEEMEMDSSSEERTLLQPEQDIQYIQQIGQREEVDHSEEDQFVLESGQREVPHYSEEDQSVEESRQVEEDSPKEEQFVLESGQREVPHYSEEDQSVEESRQVEEDSPKEEHFIEESDLPSLPEIESQFEESELRKLADPELGMELASYNTVAESDKAAAVSIVACLVAAATAIGGAIFMFSKSKKKKKRAEQAELLITKEDSLYGNPSHAAAESCNPSEMSSYSYSFYDNKREEEEDARGSDREAQSKQQSRRKNSKRESLASSSSEYTRDTVSYGSFTTYSVMPAKKGDASASAVTPVRRSSRISKQLITP